MAIALRYAARSDVGLVRKNNQDSAYAGPHLLVVADGMGGHAGGDVASSIAVAELAALDGESHGSDALQHLEQALRHAHTLLRRRVESDPELAGMGTTVTALLRTGARLALAHIGDSRGYLLHDGELTQVTTDHTFVQRLVDEGKITPAEAEQHPQRNVIMRVLGDAQSSDEVDSSVRETTVGDRWLLCSDGLSGVVSAETIAETLRTVADPGAAADQLVQLALRAGGPDNVTCVVADVVEVASTPPATPQVVGSAAVHRNRRSVADGGAAARAAALTPVDDTPDDEADDGTQDGGPARGQTWRRILALVTVTAVLAGGAYAAYAWSQRQYYVGPDAQQVAIYRGLTQDVGPISLSSVYETQEVPLDDLPGIWRQRVEDLIPADDLDDARRIVGQVRQNSGACTDPPTPAPTTTSPAPAPTRSPATTAPSTATTAPGATPAPSSTITVVPPTTAPEPPEGC